MKAAFVIPWYGPDIPGGAEAECRRTAENLVKRGVEVEVLTTCLHSLGRSWEQNYHHPGGLTINGVNVRRFAIAPRLAHRWHHYNILMGRGQTLTPAQERDYMANMVNSPGLYRHISQAEDTLFFPIPYLFSTTVATARLAAERCIPIACLHDEPYAYFDIIRQTLLASRAVIFHTRAEYDLAREIMNFPAQRALLFGEGIDTDIQGQAERFRETYGLRRPFVLYAGRRDESKNVPFLLTCFESYARARPEGLDLVLIGDQVIELPAGLEGRIHDLGFIPTQDKADAYAAAALLCQPSVRESFSIVIMEAWLTGSPVLVHADCPATVEHVKASRGGLIFSDEAGFIKALDRIEADPGQAGQMAERGRAYVLDNFHWDVICQRYIRLLENRGRIRSLKPKPKVGPLPNRVCQAVPRGRAGDSIGREALAIADRLAAKGLAGPIYSPRPDIGLFGRVRPMKRLNEEYRPGDLLIWHYSDDSLALDEVADYPGATLLRHHGLSGPLEAEPADPWSRLEVRRARRRLAGARAGLAWAVGATHRAVEELLRAGYPQAGLAPSMVLGTEEDIEPSGSFDPQAPPILFCPDPVRPDSHLEEVVKLAVILARILPGTSLLLTGRGHGFYTYDQALTNLITRLETDLVSRRPGGGPPDRGGVLVSLAVTGGAEAELVPALTRNCLIACAADGPLDALLAGSALSLPLGQPVLAAEIIAQAFSSPRLRIEIPAAQRERVKLVGQTAWESLWAVIKGLLPDQSRTGQAVPTLTLESSK